jgi:2-succinyl-5-enolpyruvyl-6-hydroxy-3-cyclohexene-1-carboxylate synthase
LPEDRAITQLAHSLNKARRGILVAGQLPDQPAAGALANLAKKLRWPVFADITSGIRCTTMELSIIRYFDQILLSDKIQKMVKPECILHFGRPLTSKRYLQFIRKFSPDDYIHISQQPQRQDSMHLVTQRFQGNLVAFCKALGEKVEGQTDKKWHLRLTESDHHIDRFLTDAINQSAPVSEPVLPRLITRHLTTGHGLYLASSMPVRDFDMYAASIPVSSPIAANRGTSGIDGTVASACGFATGLAKPVTLVLGDLAMLHDLNSLSLISFLKNPLTIIVINNKGGGIFSFLPVSNFPQVFETYFGTPHDYRFKQAAAMFGLTYHQPNTNEALVKSYKRAIAGKKSALIEIRTDRKENFKIHREIQKQIKSLIEKPVR